jgi:5-oxoprolinase (ATP-hydrolysing) subunit A
MTIDLNCDMGESYHERIVGCDAEIMPFVTSCNIACGGHGGDKDTIKKTVDLAMQYGVRIGAHPSYPDIQNFGRVKVDMSSAQLFDTIAEQVHTLNAIVQNAGGKVFYVKPHGALYNAMSQDQSESIIVINAILSVKDDLSIMGMPKSVTHVLADQMGVSFIKEAFIDRAYDEFGFLVPRSTPHSVYDDVTQVVDQFASIVCHQNVITHTGKRIGLEVESICIHGDHPMALEFVRGVENFVKQHGINIES